MILRRYFVQNVINYRNYIISSEVRSWKNLIHCNNYSGVTSSFHKNLLTRARPLVTQYKLYTDGSINEGDAAKILKDQKENELKKVSDLYPDARMTLNNFTAKTPEKVFDIYYKQNVMAAKGIRKKIPKQLEWICTYAFVWPEKIKFESTALSKRLAAEKSAIQALHYLYKNKKIDVKGNPVYDQTVLNDLRSQLHEPIKVTVAETSVQQIEKIWEEYEKGLKPIYERTFEEASEKNKRYTLEAALNEDSTLDRNDEVSDSEDSTSDDEHIAGDTTDEKFIHPVYGKRVHPPSEIAVRDRNSELATLFKRYVEDITPLPIDGCIHEITSTIDANPVTVVVGAAGCGKSTRVPAAILDHVGGTTTAIVTQPRRVAAIGLAERVASEMGEDVGETVGYQVRLHSKPPYPPCGSVLYCTSGVLLRRLQTNPSLTGCTHVIIDEAHERDVNTDITLILLKRALIMNNNLRVIIMSATLDVDVFTKYFDSCPVIEVPGRTYPVQVMHLDDIIKKYNIHLPQTMENCKKEESKPIVVSQEVIEVIKAVDKDGCEGAILVFLPGWAEIKQTKQILDQIYDSATHVILPVHSRLSTSDQKKMFSPSLPGVRKIVLATNIAQTSVTIPDVVHVIDCGATKEQRAGDSGTSSLATVWVSQASAKQRMGRAGRVRPGYCYRLFTKEKEDEFEEHNVPEILRVPLVRTVLDSKTYAPSVKVEEFLSKLPEPPSQKAIQLAVNDLIDLGALSPSEQITRFGNLLSRLGTSPRLAACLVHAVICGGALPQANVATHCGDNIEVFADASEIREEIRETKRKYSKTSDHCALHWLQVDFEDALSKKRSNEFCDEKKLRRDRLSLVRSLSDLHLQQILLSGLMDPIPNAEEMNMFSEIDELTSAILLSGANSLLVTKKRVNTKGRLNTVTELVTSTGERAHIGSESVNYGITKHGSNQLLAYSGGQHSPERRALVVYKTSLVTPHTALLFAKGTVKTEVISDDKESTTVIYLPRHKLYVHLPTRDADSILKAREMLWNTIDYYIERDVKTLSFEEFVAAAKFKERLVKTICKVLVEADRVYIQKKKLEDVKAQVQ